MRIGPLGVWELLIILVVVLLIFGPRRLPEMAKGLGQSVREFRKGIRDMREDFEEGSSSQKDAAQAPAASTPAPAQATAGQAPAAQTPAAQPAAQAPAAQPAATAATAESAANDGDDEANRKA